MTRPGLVQAIETLEEELAALDRQSAELRSTINLLCQRAGLDVRYVETDSQGQAVIGTGIKPDSFYGKKMQTAAREFLEMRRRADSGPAKPREIYAAMAKGGFQFETKDETTALVSLRAMLRKNSATFHKLPGGEYGLRAWYPNPKSPKDDNDNDLISKAATKTALKRTKKRSSKSAKAKKSTEPKKSNPSVAPFVKGAIQDGSKWTTVRLRQEAVAQGVPGIDLSTKLNSFHAALLGLKSRGLVELVEKGVWRAAKPDATGVNSTHEPATVIPIKAAST